MVFIAKERVVDSREQGIGYVLNDGLFYNNYYIKQKIDRIENLRMIRDAVAAAETVPAITYRTYLKRQYEQLLADYPDDAKAVDARFKLDAITQREREQKLLLLPCPPIRKNSKLPQKSKI